MSGEQALAAVAVAMLAAGGGVALGFSLGADEVDRRWRGRVRELLRGSVDADELARELELEVGEPRRWRPPT